MGPSIPLAEARRTLKLFFQVEVPFGLFFEIVPKFELANHSFAPRLALGRFNRPCFAGP